MRLFIMGEFEVLEKKVLQNYRRRLYSSGEMQEWNNKGKCHEYRQFCRELDEDIPRLKHFLKWLNTNNLLK